MVHLNDFFLRELMACQADMRSKQQTILKNAQAIPAWQKGALLFCCCVFLSDPLLAQGETIAKLTAVKTWVNGIINIIFIIAILYASIMCVLKFVRQEQGAWGYAFGVLMAFILWGGFTTYKNDIFQLMGGSNTIMVE